MTTTKLLSIILSLIMWCPVFGQERADSATTEKKDRKFPLSTSVNMGWTYYNTSGVSNGNSYFGDAMGYYVSLSVIYKKFELSGSIETMLPYSFKHLPAYDDNGFLNGNILVTSTNIGYHFALGDLVVITPRIGVMSYNANIRYESQISNTTGRVVSNGITQTNLSLGLSFTPTKRIGFQIEMGFSTQNEGFSNRYAKIGIRIGKLTN